MIDVETSEQVRILLVLHGRNAGLRSWIYCLQPQEFHEPAHPLPTYSIALSLQQLAEPPGSKEWRGREQLVDCRKKIQRLFAWTGWLVVQH
jgi:hypothetical protein